MVLLEGGAQSLLQSLNALQQGAEIFALEGLREPDIEKFSAARLFSRITKEPHVPVETHLKAEIAQQSEWKPNKLRLLNQAKELLRKPELLKRLHAVTVISRTAPTEEQEFGKIRSKY